ncbi:uncharacterized protein [Miscanthus floridulus]|uniref:uncharacterized protein n=1 Tax=Miscanthus floridulus TaxID=154761 RepID=UPI003457B581
MFLALLPLILFVSCFSSESGEPHIYYGLRFSFQILLPPSSLSPWVSPSPSRRGHGRRRRARRRRPPSSSSAALPRLPLTSVSPSPSSLSPSLPRQWWARGGVGRQVTVPLRAVRRPSRGSAAPSLFPILRELVKKRSPSRPPSRARPRRLPATPRLAASDAPAPAYGPSGGRPRPWRGARGPPRAAAVPVSYRRSSCLTLHETLAPFVQTFLPLSPPPRLFLCIRDASFSPSGPSLPTSTHQIFPGCGWMKLRSDLCLSDLIIELRLPVLCYKTKKATCFFLFLHFAHKGMQVCKSVDIFCTTFSTVNLVGYIFSTERRYDCIQKH